MTNTVKTIVIIVAIVGLLYGGNTLIQTHLGKSAVADLTFPIYSYDEAMTKSKDTGKLVLADYSAIWCPSCRKLDTQVFANKEVSQAITENFVYSRIEYDSNEGLMFSKKYSIVGFPRVLVLDSKGAKVTELPLTFDPKEYTENLSKVASNYQF